MIEVIKPLRTIRSYVRREGRITPAQQRALQDLWPRYGVLDAPARIDLTTLFGRDAPVEMEIGFGNGDAMAAMARANPETNYLGVEVHRPGIGSLLLKLEADKLNNVRVIQGDAKEVLATRIADAALTAAYLFFPDPWPKKRHHKRRLLQADFVAVVRTKLKSGGWLHLATDWQDYAEQMMAVMTQAPGFANSAGSGQYAPRPDYRPLTRFERRGQNLGHRVWDLIFERVA